jgi:hypothetical protein
MSLTPLASLAGIGCFLQFLRRTGNRRGPIAENLSHRQAVIEVNWARAITLARLDGFRQRQPIPF